MYKSTKLKVIVQPSLYTLSELSACSAFFQTTLRKSFFMYLVGFFFVFVYFYHQLSFVFILTNIWGALNDRRLILGIDCVYDSFYELKRHNITSGKPLVDIEGASCSVHLLYLPRWDFFIRTTRWNWDYGVPFIFRWKNKVIKLINFP